MTAPASEPAPEPAAAAGQRRLKAGLVLEELLARFEEEADTHGFLVAAGHLRQARLSLGLTLALLRGGDAKARTQEARPANAAPDRQLAAISLCLASLAEEAATAGHRELAESIGQLARIASTIQDEPPALMSAASG